MSDIYTLQGRGDSGKSDTIKIIFAELVRKYPSASVQRLSSGTRDIKAILTNVKGHKVGIESQGDPGSRLQQSLQDFANANCTIIICATRTSGMTVNWVHSLSPPYVVHFIPQVYATTNFDANNSHMALSIIAQAGL
ncbi:MAG TPA: hypothetical protein VFF41_06475 [Gallionella sp.]|nr:hypothetical protein [Gallionella sp.]